MGIASLKFIAFIAVSLIAYYLVPNKYQWVVLLVASIIFYLSYSIWGIFVLIATALITWFFALQIQKSKDDEEQWLRENHDVVDKETRKVKKSEFHHRQSQYELVAVVITIAILFLTKYYGPMAKQINCSFEIQMWTAENILLPLGISYYSLQLIGYIVDVKRDIIPAEKNPVKVILYGMFFLSIMQGPFNRYSDLMPQICQKEKPKPDFLRIRFSLLRILGGYIKKLCIADQVGQIANEVFTNSSNYFGFGIIFGVICFAIQLYADFSGYMDIIIGIGELFGIQMPENFRQPFFSRNMSEFWRRWHITLGAWLKDYVFYPILKSKAFLTLGKSITNHFGKEAGRKIPTYLGMLILWTLIGAWHGAGFNYVFGVGILQFLYIFIGEILDPVSRRVKSSLRIHEEGLPWHIFQSLRSTILMMIAWVFFKSKTFEDAIQVFKNIFTPNLSSQNSILEIFCNGNSTVNYGNHGYVWIVYVIICAAVLLAVDLLKENGVSIRATIEKKSTIVRVAIYIFMVVVLMVFGAYGSQYVPSNFIYFEF